MEEEEPGGNPGDQELCLCLKCQEDSKIFGSIQAEDVHLGINSNLHAVNACMNEWSDNAEI